MERITREEYYKEAVLLISRRSSCIKKQLRALLIKDKRVIAQGYNGVLPDINPIKGIDTEGKTDTVHAEANLIAFCAKHGIPTNGTTMYITLSPCCKCAELIIQAGVMNVFYIEEYRDNAGLSKLIEHGINVIKL